MDLKTNYKKVNLVFTTRKIVDITRILQGKNFEDLYFKAVNDNDIEALSKIIYIFAENEDGTKAFKNSEEVYDFIDDYKSENKKSYKDIFQEIAKAINDEGFFNSKMKMEEIKEKISNPFSSIDLNTVIKTSTEKAITELAQKELTQQA